MSARLAILTLMGTLVITSAAFADDTPSVQLFIQNQQFSPQEFKIPSNTKVEILVNNQDSLPAEFESYDLSREVVVPGKSQVKVFIGPLPPGRYNFFNDFNHAAQGWVMVDAPAANAKAD